MGSRQSGTQTVTSRQQPWSEQLPFISDLFGEAAKWYHSGAPLSPEREQAVRLARDYTAPGAPLARGIQEASRLGEGGGLNSYKPVGGLAGQQREATLRGDYLQANNPVYREMLSGVSDIVAPRIAGQFTAAGRQGRSPLAAEAFARGVSSGMLPYLQSERGRQTSVAESEAARSESARQADLNRQIVALGLTPDLVKNRVGLLSDAGALQDPFEKLRQYRGLLSGNYGGESEQSQPLYSDPFATGLGYASTLASLGQSLFGSAGGGLLNGMLGGGQGGSGLLSGLGQALGFGGAEIAGPGSFAPGALGATAGGGAAAGGPAASGLGSAFAEGNFGITPAAGAAGAAGAGGALSSGIAAGTAANIGGIGSSTAAGAIPASSLGGLGAAMPALGPAAVVALPLFMHSLFGNDYVQPPDEYGNALSQAVQETRNDNTTPVAPGYGDGTGNTTAIEPDTALNLSYMLTGEMPLSAWGQEALAQLSDADKQWLMENQSWLRSQRGYQMSGSP